MIDTIFGPAWYEKMNAQTVDSRRIVDESIQKSGVPCCRYAALILLYRILCKRRDALGVQLIIANKTYKPGADSDAEIAEGMARCFELIETFEMMGVVMYQVQADLRAMDRTWLYRGMGLCYHSLN